MIESSENGELSLDEMKQQVELETKRGAHKTTISIAISFTVFYFLAEPSRTLVDGLALFLAVLLGCYFWFHWWLSKVIARSFAEARMKKKSADFARWADSRDKEEEVERRKQKEAKRLADEKEEVARKEKERVKRIRENDWGMLSKFGALSSVHVCYWCGAEENFLEFVSGQIARKEWKHMNENGAPDKRYKDNPLTVVFDSQFRCSNCDAINEYRHWCDEEPYEKGRVEIGWLLESGNTPFNETKFLRDRNTGKVLDNPNPNGDSTKNFLNSNNVEHRTPFMR